MLCVAVEATVLLYIKGRKMKIQLLSGGLASQVFQYVFARYAELTNKDEIPWFFDDSSFFVTNVHNGYELEKVFGIKANLLSKHFDNDVWQEYVSLRDNGISLPQTFLDAGEEVVMYAETDDFKDVNPFTGHVLRMLPEGGFYPQITQMKDPIVYYHGTWVDRRWFDSYRDIFLKELTFPELTYPQAIQNAELMEKGTAIGIHIRRGDYIAKGLTLDSNYYRDSLKEIAEKYEQFTLFVFSDDLYWCNQHSNELGLHYASKIIYVSGNYGPGSYVDLQLMTKCKGLIIANSAFSYLGAIMNPALETLITPPKPEENIYNY